MNPLDKLSEEMNHLVSNLSSHPVVGDLNTGITQYSFFLAVAMILLLILIFSFKAKQAKSLTPKGFFVNGMEFLVEFIRDDLCKPLLGDAWREHFPFIATVFFFILVNNIVGVIPGMKPATGAIGTAAAVAVVSFCYFVVAGVKKHGLGGYLKSLAPAGVPFPMNVLVWLIELFSTFLRLVTLSVRLFANLFAGHVVMGTFAVLAALFFEPLLQAASAQTALMASASIFWVFLLIVIYAVELLVAAIQAYVFTLLSAVYVQLAIADAH